MILADTGPLVALIDADDPHHARCKAALEGLPAEPLITTWPCFTEAMYLLNRAAGSLAQDELWQWVADGLATLHLPAPTETERMRELMRQYRDAPMDLADASLVTAAEQLGCRRVFTIDRHFHAYLAHDRVPFAVLP